mgnify:CR=1 FL=1
MQNENNKVNFLSFSFYTSCSFRSWNQPCFRNHNSSTPPPNLPPPPFSPSARGTGGGNVSPICESRTGFPAPYGRGLNCYKESKRGRMINSHPLCTKPILQGYRKTPVTTVNILLNQSVCAGRFFRQYRPRFGRSQFYLYLLALAFLYFYRSLCRFISLLLHGDQVLACLQPGKFKEPVLVRFRLRTVLVL